MRRNSPNTIRELAEAGYRLTISKFDKDLQQYINQFGFASTTDSDVLLGNAYFHDKNVIPIQRLLGSKVLSSEYKFKEFEDPVKFASDNLLTDFTGISIDKNHHMFKTIRDVLEKLFEAGILQHIHNNMNMNSETSFKSLHRTEFKIYDRMPLETVLSWNYLYAGFSIWIGFVLLAILVFSGELCYERYVKKGGMKTT